MREMEKKQKAEMESESINNSSGAPSSGHIDTPIKTGIPLSTKSGTTTNTTTSPLSLSNSNS